MKMKYNVLAAFLEIINNVVLVSFTKKHTDDSAFYFKR